jgi:hypothetical protein
MTSKEYNIELQRKKRLIHTNKHLFWWVPKEKKEDISLDALVEAILNYGDANSVKELINTLGIRLISEIFKKNTSNRMRVNYYPEVINYFDLYFSKYVQGYSKS